MQRDRHKANIELIFAVASKLGELLPRVVFCGGAVTGLLITDDAAPDVSSTKDVDAIVEAASLGQYGVAQESLRKLGFKHDMSKDAPACRFLIDGIMVDLMPTDGSNFGWATTFYPAAVNTAIEHRLTIAGEELLVKVISAPMFIATKLEAFSDRGKGDYGGSKDMADIIAIVEGRAELESEVREMVETLAKKYVCESFAKIATDPAFLDVADFFGENPDLVLERLKAISAIR